MSPQSRRSNRPAKHKRRIAHARVPTELMPVGKEPAFRIALIHATRNTILALGGTADLAGIPDAVHEHQNVRVILVPRNHPVVVKAHKRLGLVPVEQRAGKRSKKPYAVVSGNSVVYRCNSRSRRGVRP